MGSSQKKISRLLQSFFKNCTSTYCLPYRFNENRGFYVTESKWELFLWRLNAFACIFVAAFAVGRMIQFNVDDGVPVGVQLYMRLIAPIHSIALLVVQIPTWKSRHDIVSLAQQAQKLFANYEEAADLETKDKILLGTVRFIQYGLQTNAILLIAIGILRPDSPEMLTSLLYSTEKHDPTWNIILRIPTTLLYIWTVNTALKGVTAVVSLYVTSIFWTHVRLVSMRRTIQRDPQKATGQLKEFKAVAILIKIYEDAISASLPAGKLVTILPAIFALYAVVRIGGMVAVFAGVYAIDTILFIEILLILISQVYAGSWDWREEVKKCVSKRNSTLAKEVRSVTAMRVRLGGLYYVDKGLVLTVLETIAQNSINMLLLNP